MWPRTAHKHPTSFILMCWHRHSLPDVQGDVASQSSLPLQPLTAVRQCCIVVLVHKVVSHNNATQGGLRRDKVASGGSPTPPLSKTIMPIQFRCRASEVLATGHIHHMCQCPLGSQLHGKCVFLHASSVPDEIPGRRNHEVSLRDPTSVCRQNIHGMRQE